MRGRLTEVRGPAMGVALAKCYLARAFHGTSKLGEAVTNSHPQECRFCLYTDDEVRAMLDDFNLWAGIEGQLRPEVEAFAMLPIEEQRALSAKAANPTMFDDP